MNQMSIDRLGGVFLWCLLRVQSTVRQAIKCFAINANKNKTKGEQTHTVRPAASDPASSRSANSFSLSPLP
ncbi:hypothetical protein N658DRAFT_221824 [Parathielavia hyrcaniae]|uniref:Secreted protein n=1 Tax=Parathielavia hyrcaniae TaxID=113614 RepID=A0AAN6PXD7_9PEZI|nr:hypothetical protein N658DRAFT_221824 [Parathielavia hyrcaniae]